MESASAGFLNDCVPSDGYGSIHLSTLRLVSPSIHHEPPPPPAPTPSNEAAEDIPFRRENDAYSLWWSALEGAPAAIKDLLDRGADVNATYNGTTPLVQSAISGHEAVTASLLKMHGIDVNLRNHAGQTALWCAAHLGHSAIVQRLLEKDDINTECRDEGGQTPLGTAVVEGHLEVVELLLAKGADVNARDGAYELPPIFWAMQLKTTEIALLLISQESFDSTLQDRSGRTALDRAQELDLPSMVTSLLRKRADDSITDALRQTPVNKASVPDDLLKRPVIGFTPSTDSEKGLGRGSAGRDDQVVRTSCAVIVLSGFFFFLLLYVHSRCPLF